MHIEASGEESFGENLFLGRDRISSEQADCAVESAMALQSGAILVRDRWKVLRRAHQPLLTC